jgi:uncharacterized protein
MKTRQFGKFNWQASVLGFGCMRLPVIDGKSNQIDEPQATRMLHSGIERGINYIDTAYGYHGGQSELFVGRALQGGYRQKTHLATKMPVWLVQTRADFDRLLDEQLGRLQTDHIDHYLLHALNRERWDILGKMDLGEWAARAKASGKIGSFGFSFHDNLTVFEKILVDFDGWDFCQIQHNYIDIIEQAGTKGLRMAAARGLAVVIMEPLLGGKLATPPEVVQKIFDAAPVQHTPADWALQWLWNQPEVTVVLSGMGAQQQVDENLASAAVAQVGSLSREDMQLIGQVRAKYREIVPVSCTKCMYCMPCPNGVDIPRNFENFNKGAMLDAWGSARFRYGQIGEGERASACQDCDECESKCPQHLPISDWMPYIHEVLAKDAAWDGRTRP